MALLLISRGSFSGGMHVARCLTETAGWKCLTREDLVAAVNAHGEIAARITASVPNAIQDYARFSALRRPYKILTLLALLDSALEGDVAYVGDAGHLLLRGIPHALTVRIYASLAHRVKLLRERESLTQEEARERVRLADETRRRWARLMYGRSLGDPEPFDLTLNLDRMSVRAACSVIIYASQQEQYAPTPESMTLLRSRHLAARVLAELVLDPTTSEIEIDATAQDGKVTLTGPHIDDDVRRAVLDKASRVAGGGAVEYSVGYPASFGMW